MQGNSGATSRWSEVLARCRPLVLPGAYDALSARLIEQAGFEAMVIGGFPLVGARYGLPDIGLVGLAEMAAGAQDIIRATRIPALVDADQGYGDVRSVTRTVRMYESLGAAALLLEDQVVPKRCGHLAGKQVVSAAEMERKVRAAVAARSRRDLFIIARTDARMTLGLDEALRRAERYVRAGADGIFVEAPESMQELETIARSLDVPQMCNMLIGGRTPIVPAQVLHEMGFRMIVHGTTLIKRVAKVLQTTLTALREGRVEFPEGDFSSLADFMQITDLDYWMGLDRLP